MNPRIVTIGVYGFSESTFLHALQAAEVDTLWDLRARRGLRGKQYAFANKNRLQALLEGASIRYAHLPELAPSAETRDVQRHADHVEGIAKRERTELTAHFREEYARKHLNQWQPRNALHRFAPTASVIALLCVEKEPTACHRSLVAAALEVEIGTPVRHLLPPSNLE